MSKNREIEVKLKVRDAGALVSRLEALGARKIGCVHEENTLFDTADEFFRKQEAILRLRREEPAPRGIGRNARERGRVKARDGILTFKGLVDGANAAGSRYKEREEIEFRVTNVARFAGVLRRIGMRPWFRYEKYRTTYASRRYPGLKLELDETPIGAFLELEGPKRQIDRAARALGYSRADYITASYLELYADAAPRRGSRRGNMMFRREKMEKL